MREEGRLTIVLILEDPVAEMLPGGVRGEKVDYSADPGRSYSRRCCLVV